MAHLREVMVEAGKNPVKPLKIHEVRWSSSHREVLRREYVHAPIWWEHYARISTSDSFSQTQREKASYLQDAIEDKNARLISVFLLDILTLFGKVSEEFQKKGESVLGLFNRIKQLKDGKEIGKATHIKA